MTMAQTASLVASASTTPARGAHPRRHRRRHRLRRPGAGAHPRPSSGGHADRRHVVGRHQRAAAAAGAGAHLGGHGHCRSTSIAWSPTPTSSSSRCPRRHPPSSRRSCSSAALRVIDLSGAFRIRDDARRRAGIRRRRRCRRRHRLRVLRTASRRHRGRRGSCPIPGCYPTAALIALEPLAAAGLLDGPVVVDAKSGHLRRRQDAVRSDALLRESRERRGLRRLLAPPHRRDRAGARHGRSRSCRTWCRSIAASSRRSTRRCGRARPRQQVADALHAAYANAPFVRLTGDDAARDQARRAHQLLRHRLEGGRRRAAARARRGARQPGEGRGRLRGAEPEHHARPRRAHGPALMTRPHDRGRHGDGR